MHKLNIKNPNTILITLVVLIVDIISKQLVINLMFENQSIKLINKFLYITYVKNTGVAFSFLEGKVPIIIIATLGIALFLIKYIYDNKLDKYETVAYGFVLGGAIGNLIDRVFYSYVIDFIEVYIFNYNFPIFNIADSFIVIGILLILVYSIKKESSDNDVINRRKRNKNR